MIMRYMQRSRDTLRDTVTSYIHQGYRPKDIKEVRRNGRGDYYYLMSDTTIWTTEMDTFIDPRLGLPKGTVVMTLICGTPNVGSRYEQIVAVVDEAGIIPTPICCG